MDKEGFSEGGEESGGETSGDYNNDAFEFRVEEEVSVFAIAIASIPACLKETLERSDN